MAPSLERSVPKPFSHAVSELLNDAEKKAERRLLWLDRCTSLWSPLTSLIIVFIPYLVLIELNPCAHLWAQPLMQGLLVFLSVVFLMLSLLTVFPKWRRARSARHRARESLTEVGKVVARHRAKLGEKTSSALATDAAALRRAMLSSNLGQMEKAVQDWREQIKKLLAPYKATMTRESIGGLVTALAVALIVRTVFIEPFKIPSGSMIPTLAIGDQIFVNKFIYGIRLPWINKIVPFQIVRAPKRGDVIVFNNPVEPEKDFVKRVIGVPGDSIELKDKRLFINGTEQTVQILDQTFQFADYAENSGTWLPRSAQLLKEVVDGTPHWVMWQPDESKPQEGPYMVPEGHVFVMGDNRDNSSDSRYGLGNSQLGVQYVPFERIKGKAMVIWYSWGYKGPASLLNNSGLLFERLFQPMTRCEADPPPRELQALPSLSQLPEE